MNSFVKSKSFIVSSIIVFLVFLIGIYSYTLNQRYHSYTEKFIFEQSEIHFISKGYKVLEVKIPYSFTYLYKDGVGEVIYDRRSDGGIGIMKVDLFYLNDDFLFPFIGNLYTDLRWSSNFIK